MILMRRRVACRQVTDLAAIKAKHADASDGRGAAEQRVAALEAANGALEAQTAELATRAEALDAQLAARADELRAGHVVLSSAVARSFGPVHRKSTAT